MNSCDQPYYYILNYHLYEGKRIFHLENVFWEIKTIKIAKEINNKDWHYLFKENELVLKYERILRKEENSIRKLYNNIFNLKTTIDYQEYTILNFVSKEKEYEKLKEKTGAFYSNGKLWY